MLFSEQDDPLQKMEVELFYAGEHTSVSIAQRLLLLTIYWTIIGSDESKFSWPD